jgi:hypothetical protein
MSIKLSFNGTNNSSSGEDFKVFRADNSLAAKASIGPGGNNVLDASAPDELRAKFGDSSVSGELTLEVCNTGTVPAQDDQGNPPLAGGSCRTYTGDSAKIDVTFTKV